MGESTQLKSATTMEANAGDNKVSADLKGDTSSDVSRGGASSTDMDGDRSGNSSPPSGVDNMSYIAEANTSSSPASLEESCKPSPRKVTNPDQAMRSYKALEEGLHPTSLSANSPPLEITTTTTTTSRTVSIKNKKPSLRRGKWTLEEEAYVARVIRDFNYGYLNAPAGTTLRTYLSEKLKCDPMRITKKFTGDACIGKRVFHPAVRSLENASALDLAQSELDTLEKRWRLRLEMQQRESAKKAAASSAITVTSGGVLSSSEGLVVTETSPQHLQQQHSVTQTAEWLDRAKTALKEAPSEKQQDVGIDLEDKLQQVQRLIHEGPVIQQTSVDLPQILDTSKEPGSPGDPEPADKRLRTAEDAEALVGFLRSVHASAAKDANM